MSIAPLQSAPSPLRFYVSAAGEDNVEPHRIRGVAPSPEQIQVIEKKCNVRIVTNESKGTITVYVDPDIDASKRRPHFLAAVNALDYTLRHNLSDQDKDKPKKDKLSIETLKTHVTRLVSEDPTNAGDRRQIKKKVTALAKAFAPAVEEPAKKKEISKSEPVRIDMPYHEKYLGEFVRSLIKSAAHEPLKVFLEDRRINHAVELIDARDFKGFMTSLATFDDATTNQHQIDVIARVLTEAGEIKSRVQSTKVTYEWLGGLLDKALRPEERAEAKASARNKKEEKAKAAAPESLKLATVRITAIGGRPIDELVEHLSHPTRKAALSAFGTSDDPLLKGVAVETDNSDSDKSNTKSILLTIPAPRGVVDHDLQSFICTALSDALTVYNESKARKAENENAVVVGSALDKAWFKKWIEANIKTYKMTPGAFTPRFPTSIVTLRSFEPPAKTADDTQPAKASIATSFQVTSRPTATSEGKGRFSCPVNFQLPDFDESGVMRLKKPNGEERLIIPTPNQGRMLKDLLDPQKRIMLIDGPAGTGKSLFMAWVMLKLLKEGYIHRAYYERPIKTVGGTDVGYLKGTLDDKVGPHNQSFEGKFIELLGFGNEENGFSVFQSLVLAGSVQRYDGLFKRGDTIYDSMLAVDEAQNKNPDELWNLMTRSEGSRVIVSGDSDFQVDIRNSGFGKCFAMYQGIDEIAFHTLTREDIKRDPLIQKLYDARKAYEAQQRKEMETAKTPATGPSRAGPR